MNLYSVTVTLSDNMTKTVTLQAASPAAATMQAKYSKMIKTTGKVKIVKAEAMLVETYTPSPKVHTRALSIN